MKKQKDEEDALYETDGDRVNGRPIHEGDYVYLDSDPDICGFVTNIGGRWYVIDKNNSKIYIGCISESNRRCIKKKDADEPQLVVIAMNRANPLTNALSQMK